ncbi:MAG: phosphatase PAP2 family protein [Verrucomicrobiae bacterium]
MSSFRDTSDASRMWLRRQAAVSLLLGAALLGALLVAGYLGFVCTSAGQRWDNAGYAGRSVIVGELKAYDADLLGEVSRRTVMISLCGLVVLSLLLRCPIVGVAVAGASAAAIFGAEYLKHILPRALLAPAIVPVPAYFSSDTYPSGHTTVAASLALALVVIVGPRLRPWLAVLAGVIGSSYATGVLFLGWHRPSDALGGLALSGLCLAETAAMLVLLHGHHAPPVKSAAWALGAALAALMIGALAAAVFSKSGEIPFFSMSAAIIAAGIALPAWLAFSLRHISWRSLRPPTWPHG